MSRASCGRAVWNASRKCLHWRGGAREGAAGGRVVSAVRVRGRRSWWPCCWGLPGSMHAGRMPRRTHQADRGERLARGWVAKGPP